MNWIGMFPGQGSQEIGMGKELLKTHGDLLIDTFNESLGWSIDEVINSNNSEEIKKTNIAQPYIFAISYCYGLETIKKIVGEAKLRPKSVFRLSLEILKTVKPIIKKAP